MKRELKESASEIRIISENKTEDTLMSVRVKWGHAGRVTAAGRLYPRKVLENAISEISERVKDGQVFGFSTIPRDGVGDIESISHVWREVSLREDGSAIGTVDILPTTKGVNLARILKKGRVGMASRGVGSVVHKSGVVEGQSCEFDEVGEDFRLLSPGDFSLGSGVEGSGPISEKAGENGEVILRVIQMDGSVPKFGKLTPDEVRLACPKKK